MHDENFHEERTMYITFAEVSQKYGEQYNTINAMFGTLALFFEVSEMLISALFLLKI